MDTTNINAKPEAEAVAEIVRAGLKPTSFTLKGPEHEHTAHVMVLPDGAGGFSVESVKPYLDEYLVAPERRTGTAQLTELDSLIAHANRFKDVDSALFADPSPAAPSLTAVLNYHCVGPSGAPRFGNHRGVYTFPLSDEWRAWLASSGRKLSQGDFAAWLEDHVLDVANPDDAGDASKALAATLGCTFASPSRLLELSRGLSVRVGAKVQNAINTATGEVAMQFASEHQDERGAPLKVPTAFLLAIPVFRGGALYQVAARLRYRIDGGAIAWSFDLHRPERFFDHAFREACDRAKDGTGLPLFFGSPE